MAICLIFEQFRKRDVVLCIVRNVDSRRFKSEVNTMFLPSNIKIEFILQKSNKIITNIDEMSGIINKRFISCLVAFHEQSPIFWYFGKLLKDSGAKIILAPEGTRPYIKIAKRSLFSIARKTLHNYYLLMRSGMLRGWHGMVKNTYGYSKLLNEIWVLKVEAYQGEQSNLLKEVSYFNKAFSALKVASNFFDCPVDKFQNTLSKKVLYLNHWLAEEDVYEVEQEILENICSILPKGFNIIIKLHPNTPDFQKEIFRSLPNVDLIESNVPAELYIMSIRNSVILSLWSASLLLPTISNRYYWLYPIAKKKGFLKWFDIRNPVEHIAEVDCVSCITFEGLD